LVERELDEDAVALLGFLQENYNLVTLSIETNYRSVSEAAAKRIAYTDFLEREYLTYFSQVVANVKDASQSERLLAMTTRFDYLFQIEDSIEDLFGLKRTLEGQYIEIRSDVLLMVRELSSETLGLFDDIYKGLAAGRTVALDKRSRSLRASMEHIQRDLLVLLAHPDRTDAGALSNFVTFSRRLADKLLNFARLAPAPDAEEDEADADQGKVTPP
jgi:phosphate:Na+ symporter